MVVYVPFKATIEDVRGALLNLHKTGMTRPVPGSTTERERVYPVEYCPTDDRDVWFVYFRNDRAELIEATLHVRQFQEFEKAWDGFTLPLPNTVDPFAVE
jgi:hypothetical protein